MSITQTAKTELGAKIVGHDEVDVLERLPSGARRTGQSHTIIIPPSNIEGGTKGGMLMREDYAAESSADTQPVPDGQEPARRGRRARRKVLPQEELVQVSVTMPGFGTIPTVYRYFDVGAGILRLGITGQSWIPALAERDASGKFTNVFRFDRAAGRRYVNVGMEFVHDGQRSIVLVELPGEE